VPALLRFPNCLESTTCEFLRIEARRLNLRTSNDSFGRGSRYPLFLERLLCLNKFFREIRLSPAMVFPRYPSWKPKTSFRAAGQLFLQARRQPTVSDPQKVFLHQTPLFAVPFMTEQACLPVKQRGPVAIDLTECFFWMACRCEIRRQHIHGVNPGFRTIRNVIDNSIRITAIVSNRPQYNQRRSLTPRSELVSQLCQSIEPSQGLGTDEFQVIGWNYLF
jgi:hypothetical protein